jgi:hypothetical protein
MSQELEITLVFESEQVQYYRGDIVGDIIPIRMGTANILLRLDNQSDHKVEFARLEWEGGQPDFIKDERVTPHLIVIRDENEKEDQQGNFSFTPILRLLETMAAAVGRGSARAEREIAGPDPTIINTDIPGGALNLSGRVRQVA